MTDKEAFLNMVERNCRRLMKEGGGAIQQIVPHRGKTVPMAEQKIWIQMARDGIRAHRIAQLRGWGASTVGCYLTRARKAGVLGMTVGASNRHLALRGGVARGRVAA